MPIFRDGNMCDHNPELCREGDEYNTRKGNKSAVLVAVSNLPTPLWFFFEKDTRGYYDHPIDPRIQWHYL